MLRSQDQEEALEDFNWDDIRDENEEGIDNAAG